MFDPLQLLAREHIKEVLRDAEMAQLIRRARRYRKPSRWRSAVSSFLRRLSIPVAHPQGAFARSPNSAQETAECLPAGCC
jgi:hypothetical protein